MLHSKVLSVLKHEQPERRGQKKRKVECRRTPVYIHTSAEPGTPSINLSRLRSKELLEDKPKVGVQVGSDGQVSSEAENPQNEPDTYSLDDLTSSEPTGNLKVPHVLISLALCEDQELELKACSEWLTAFPALAKYAKVKGVYRSHSALIIASVPVVIWDLLPENRACSFIGYVTSDNLLDLIESSNTPKLAAYSQAVDGDDDSKAENNPRMMTPESDPHSRLASRMDHARPVDPAPIKIKEQEHAESGTNSQQNLSITRPHTKKRKSNKDSDGDLDDQKPKDAPHAKKRKSNKDSDGDLDDQKPKDTRSKSRANNKSRLLKLKYACHFNIKDPKRYCIRNEVGGTGELYRSCMGTGWIDLHSLL